MSNKMCHILKALYDSSRDIVCVCVRCVPRDVIVYSGTAVEEYNDSNDGCRDQHLCVDS